MTTTSMTEFAVITARPIKPSPADYRSHYQTCGHYDPNCRGIKHDSRRLPTATLGEYLMDNEYFDGEVVYLTPFRCHLCHDLCRGGTCQDILRQCSKHADQYQRRWGRAANE